MALSDADLRAVAEVVQAEIDDTVRRFTSEQTPAVAAAISLLVQRAVAASRQADQARITALAAEVQTLRSMVMGGGR